MPPERPKPGASGAKPGAPVAGEVYFEFIPQGAVMRVAAIDAATGTEAVVMGPLNAGRPALERLALAKLRYVLARRKG